MDLPIFVPPPEAYSNQSNHNNPVKWISLLLCSEPSVGFPTHVKYTAYSLQWPRDFLPNILPPLLSDSLWLIHVGFFDVPCASQAHTVFKVFKALTDIHKVYSLISLQMLAPLSPSVLNLQLPAPGLFCALPFYFLSCSCIVSHHFYFHLSINR